MANQHHDAFVMAHRADGCPFSPGTILQIKPGLTLAPLMKGTKSHGDWHVFVAVNSKYRCGVRQHPEPHCQVLMYMGFCNLREPTNDGRQKSHLWLWGDRLVSINPNIVATQCTEVRRTNVRQKASRQAGVS